jgi:hypothetical protein
LTDPNQIRFTNDQEQKAAGEPINMPPFYSTLNRPSSASRHCPPSR